ncbi:putative NADH-ubiquinone oxidoreductase 9.5 kDa subunit [Polychaeton citri CBS 116435]|uniref:NADH-ubiquinone oxidoreductase 9.5 kDa subunit n=1 Tax=Polychaeton citri CBS 116435 TaxID=1314669 RepID=A0A9P4PWU4_9PEZI|nr:putative NADH-ubiquinone oxidoreductase 9.5 kDa subunit [Polychaeton citri CBS 116435]
MAPVSFWSTPFQYLHWASRAKPAIFWSIVVGSFGPIMVAAVPPIRHRFGDGPRQHIPLTYPIPKGPRKIPQGYDD